MTSSLRSFSPRNHKLGLIALAGIALVSSACRVTSTDNGGGSGGSGGSSVSSPEGPVAHDASEAFPDKPDSVPVLTAEQIAQACATVVACELSDAKYTQQDRLQATYLCLDNITWSAERAIPLSGLILKNERAEPYVGCVIQHAGDCSAVAACGSDRSASIYCQEDGCGGPRGGQVSCQGTVATIDTGKQTITRDCASAYAECDPSSPTGCTDRHFTACPADDPHVDHCDGDVRLGCDHTGQVSYHDCSRMGGTCGEKPDGHQDCIYTASPECDDTALPSCSGSAISACVNGQLVTLDAPGLCIGT